MSSIDKLLHWCSRSKMADRLIYVYSAIRILRFIQQPWPIVILILYNPRKRVIIYKHHRKLFWDPLSKNLYLIKAIQTANVRQHYYSFFVSFFSVSPALILSAQSCLTRMWLDGSGWRQMVWKLRKSSQQPSTVFMSLSRSCFQLSSWKKKKGSGPICNSG
jgi:hypothetical protein